MLPMEVCQFSYHTPQFQVIFPNLNILLFTNYYSLITIHHFTIHHFQGQFDIPRKIQKFHYSHDTIHLREKTTIHVHYSFHRKLSLRVLKFA